MSEHEWSGTDTFKSRRPAPCGCKRAEVHKFTHVVWPEAGGTGYSVGRDEVQ